MKHDLLERVAVAEELVEDDRWLPDSSAYGLGLVYVALGAVAMPQQKPVH
jgi:hypothetical protein